MRRLPKFLAISGAGLLCLAPFASVHAQQSGDVTRGAYVYRAAGCQGCHTDPADQKKKILLSGGRALKTPFGIYYTPNITPDPETGLGKWNFANFRRALRDGKNPAGENYFPVFPYPAYTKMSETDMRDLWAYLRSVPAVKRANKAHDTKFIFGIRFFALPWRILYFTPGAMAPDPDKSAEWNRGAYLVEALSHCTECHTPRNFLGGFVGGKYLAGTLEGPDGDPVPNITPDPETGIGEWSEDDYESLLGLGMLPDGDFIGGEMTEVYENTSKMTDADRRAMITYLKTVPPIRNKISKKEK